MVEPSALRFPLKLKVCAPAVTVRFTAWPLTCPEIAADPHNGVTMHKLVATDAVVFDPEQRKQFGFDFAVCAFYEQIPATKWELAIRPEPTCQKSE